MSESRVRRLVGVWHPGGHFSMKIQKVHIKNFRALKDVEIQFDDVTTLVGPNGAGKSTVLRALDWYFNGRAGLLSDSDCSFGAKDEAIEVEVTFSELTDADRDALGKYAPTGAPTFTAWKRRAPDGAETFSANAKGYPQFNDIKAAQSATQKKQLYGTLRRDQPGLGLPTANSSAAIDEALQSWESSHTDDLEEAPEILQTRFFGFNSDGKMSGLFDFVLVTADLRAGEEAIDGKASIIGKILERSIDRSAADEQIAVIIEESRKKQQQVYTEKFSEQLQNMTSQLNDVVDSYSPGRSVSVKPAEFELKAPRTSFDVSVLDGSTETAVDRQGHGFQRTLLISALQLLAQSGAASADGTICLAIEEPELFQHPIQAQAFAKILRSLAEDATKRIQVTYATHSPYFVEARHFSQVRRLTRSSGETPVVKVDSATVEDVKSRLAGTVDDAVVDRQLDGVILNRLSVALFANRVLLVEGDTEGAILYGIGDRESFGSLESRGLSIVASGGKGGIPLAHAIVTSLGIPTHVLFDGDAGFESRSAAAGKDAVAIEKERARHSAENKRLLAYLGETETEFPAEIVGTNASTLSDQLEDYLSSNWTEWVEACAATEADSGIELKKNQHAYRTATLRAGGDTPQFLQRVLDRAEGSGC